MSSSFQRFRETRDHLYTVLRALAQIAEQRGTRASDIGTLQTEAKLCQRSLAEILRERAENVQRKRAFRLAVIGEFNAGKSTLINALLGKRILPTSLQPTTAAITTLRYGTTERFRVTYRPEINRPPITLETQELLKDIAKYVSDPAQTGDGGISILNGEKDSLAAQIKEVEVWCNAAILRDQEIEIVDTLGLGSVLPLHKQITEALIPEVDATLFLFNAEKGVGESDIAFLKYMREYISQMLFVLTKSDYTRDETELDDLLSLTRETIIRDVPIIDIQHIYAVSAQQALDGDYETSGFSDFTDALQHFLVKSSGTIRLQVPLQVAKENWSFLKGEIEHNVRLTGESLEKIIENRQKLEREREIVIQRKNDLSRYITNSVQDMLQDTKHGIDVLPAQLQTVVERQIDTYNLKQLYQADRLIRTTIKEEIEVWFAEKEQRFVSKAELLQQRIEEDLRAILQTIHHTQTLESHEREVEIKAPQIRGMFGRGIVRFARTTAVKSSVMLATGMTLSGVMYGLFYPYAIAAGILAPPTLIIIPIILAARTAVVETTHLPKRVREDLKAALRQPMPNNYVNVYEAIVKGYFDEKGTHQLGLTELLSYSFDKWVEDLKGSIEALVTNNLDNYQYSLDERIRVEESGKWKRDDELRKLNEQDAELLRTEKTLIELETIIEKLSSESL